MATLEQEHQGRNAAGGARDGPVRWYLRAMPATSENTSARGPR